MTYLYEIRVKANDAMPGGLVDELTPLGYAVSLDRRMVRVYGSVNAPDVLTASESLSKTAVKVLGVVMAHKVAPTSVDTYLDRE